MMIRRPREVLWAVVLGWALVPGAHADMLGGGTDGTAAQLYSGSEFVQGSSAEATTLQLAGAGTLTLVLTDMQFPAAFESLSFAVTDTSSRLASMSGPGTLSLAVAGPATLYADVFANTEGTTNVGLYNLQVNFLASAPVPLPATGVLLAVALGLLGVLARARRGRTYNCNTSHGLISPRP